MSDAVPFLGPARRLGLSLALVAGVAVAWRGGYPDDARGALTALAGLAVLLAVVGAPRATARMTRAPMVRVLVALATLTALSAAWTTGSPGGALRDAAVVVALVAVLIAAGAMPGPGSHVAILLAVALMAALAGLVATLTASEPYALEICGAWRPAGPFEYPPALALICAGALPGALRVMVARSAPTRSMGALAGWILALTIALTANRTGIALGGLALLVAAVLAPTRRATVAACATGLILAGAASAVALGMDPSDDGAARLLAGLAPGLLLVGIARSAWYVRMPQTGLWLVLATAAVLAGTLGGVAIDRAGPCGGDLSHGRSGIWQAGLDTALQRPLQGYGAATFYRASYSHQLRQRPVPTRFAHDLALEAWVELGAGGLVLVLGWYLATALAVLRAGRRQAWLLTPAVIAFPLSNLLDWPWHFAGAGVLWAIAAGGLLGSSATER